MDIPAGVGYLTVTARVITAISDSTDAGTVPDAIPQNCKVTLAPLDIPDKRPFVVVDDAAKTIIQLKPIVTLIKDGDLYVPLDGQNATTIDGLQPVESVPLVAPVQAAIDMNNWRWQATFEPYPGDTYWRRYSITLSGQPGDVISLGAAAMSSAGSVLSLAPRVWVQSGTTTPAGSSVGEYLLDQDTGNLYLIGA